MAGAYVGSNSNKNDSGSSSVAVTYTMTAGNNVVVFVTHAGNITATLDDDKGTSYGVSLGSPYDNSADDQGGDYFVGLNHAGGSTVFTAHFSPNEAFVGIFVVEISGTATSGAEVGHASQYQSAANGTDAASSGSFSPSTQPGIIVALSFSSDGGTLPSAGTGFTSRATGWAFSGSDDARVETKSYSSTGSTSATFTTSSARHCLTMAVALKDTAGAAVVNDGIFFGCNF